MEDKVLENSIKELVTLGEREWIEFKRNYESPQEIGEYISALSNSACICNQPFGYLIFGVDNETHELSKKAIRVIIYKGKNKLDTIKEYPLTKGYALEFQNIINYIIESLPTNEIIESATRKKVELYPVLAIRELLANLIIHQDFYEDGTSPMVEIYSNDRIEFINPGAPLVDTLRFIDCAPVSRNIKLAKFMRRVNFCEERGTGIDKVVSSVEEYQLPAPEFIVDNNFTKVILFAPRDIKRMDREDKIRACYQHCCLKQVMTEAMTNESLRKRLNIQDKNYPAVSVIIRETIAKGLIKAEKNAKYVPFWA